jgi:dTDP-N-acetylfucosamine:lipid II N-acetylfucosaminyltransferase
VANNHFEALERLSTLDLRDRKVLTPLAYGDPEYRDAVVYRGRRLLGDSFEPVLQPMPFEEYLDRVSRCGVHVMNHYRQQGLGNVGIGLHSGAHIYLSRRNPLYAFLDRSRLDIHDLETVTSLPDGPVTGDVLQRRRERMKAIWGEDIVLENVRRLLDSATSLR